MRRSNRNVLGAALLSTALLAALFLVMTPSTGNAFALGGIGPRIGAVDFGPAGEVSPYLGAGVGVHFYGSDGPGDPGNDPSVNFFGGLLLPTRPMTLFVEGRAAVSDRDQFGILTGATFGLGR